MKEIDFDRKNGRNTNRKNEWKKLNSIERMKEIQMQRKKEIEWDWKNERN